MVTDDVRDTSTWTDYLTQVPHCSLDGLKKLEREGIKLLRGQRGCLWHLRLAYPSLEHLRELSHQVPEFQGIPFPALIQDCYPCNIVKATKIPHKTTRRRDTRPSEMLHTDVIGEILPPVYPGNKQFILAIFDGDYSRYAFIYPID